MKSVVLKMINRIKALSQYDQYQSKLRHEIDYLMLEVSRLRSIVRYLTAQSGTELPLNLDTKESFDFQWSDSPDGDWVKHRPDLKEREPKLVCQYTQLPRSWFLGKKILDAGCGSGRFTWAMASMGATVTAVDQSEAGIQRTKEACKDFSERVEVHQHDLTKPFNLFDKFDMVWSFGVLHHTGDTYGAFNNIAQLVKPGGILFMMLYGEPSGSDPGEFAYYVEVERLRRQLCHLEFRERYNRLLDLKGEEAGGWFDAVSPRINDTYSFYEIQLWLLRAGFSDIRRTMDHSNHFITARR